MRVLGTTTLRAQYERARTMARRVNGRGDVLELNDRERQALPRYVVPIGRLAEMVYDPADRSDKAGSLYRHRSGDRGPARPTSGRRPWLVADPRNGQPRIVQAASLMKVEGKWLVG